MKLDNEEQRGFLMEIIEGLSFSVAGKDIEVVAKKIGDLKESIRTAKLERDRSKKKTP